VPARVRPLDEMTLQQLRFLAAVFESDFNITAAAAKLNATQPAVSRQIQLLEQELGFTLFSRNGSALSRVTPAGARVIEYARRALRETQNIRNVGAELNDPGRGELRLGATHSEARYLLPSITGEFRTRFPKVQLSLHEGALDEIAEMAREERVDLVIASGSHGGFDSYVQLPVRRLEPRLVVPRAHTLATAGQPTLAQIAAFPVAVHVLTSGDEAYLREVFARAGADVHLALQSRDADVVKTYVRHGMGVGLVADLALEPSRDEDLVAIDVAVLFGAQTIWAGISRDGPLRSHVYEFIALLAPFFTRERIDGTRM
jgi:LysR family transcriptional regulator, cys regulon transcriptional activator